jgi:hypothetical protein
MTSTSTAGLAASCGVLVWLWLIMTLPGGYALLGRV